MEILSSTAFNLGLRFGGFGFVSIELQSFIRTERVLRRVIPDHFLANQFQLVMCGNRCNVWAEIAFGIFMLPFVVALCLFVD